MKRIYTEPELEIRKYRMACDSVTTSTPDSNEKNDLNNGDEIDYFGN